MTRRFFAFVLAFLMLFSSMPMEALASTLPEETTSDGLIVTTQDETTVPETTEVPQTTSPETEAPVTTTEAPTVPETTEETIGAKPAMTNLQPLCGLEEHTHGEDCSGSECVKKEHTHVSSCYIAPVVTDPIPETTEEEIVPETTEEEVIPETTEEEIIPETTEEEIVPETTEEEIVPETTEEEVVPETTEEVIILEDTIDTPMLFSYDRNTGYPQDLNDQVWLAVYNGADFPGEPVWYNTANYQFFNGSFSTGMSAYATRASSVFKSDILNVLTQGPTTDDGVKVWGYYNANGTKDYFLDGSALLDRANEEIIIRRIKGNRVNVDDYKIIWYVIKYQTDTYWHIDGLVVEIDKYNVNYYGNGNTSGGAPNGTTGLLSGEKYTVLDNIGNLVKVVDGEIYTFTGWNTEPDGTGTSYSAGDVITITSDVSLYAQWQPPIKETISDAYGSIILTGQKIWIDDGVHPDRITVILYANGTEVARTTASAPNYTYSFDVSNIPNAADVTFTIGEEAVPGYSLTSVIHPDVVFANPTNSGGWKKTTPCSVLNYENTSSGKTIIAAKMTSDGTVIIWSPDALALFERELIISSLEADADGLGNPKQYVFLSGEGASSEYGLTVNSSSLTFGAPKNWSMFWNGTYSRGSSGTTTSSLTNTLATESYKVQKTWEDDDDRDALRPTSITVQLYKTVNGQKTAVGAPVTIDNSTTWTHQWTGLSQYENGHRIDYSAEEVTVPNGYQVSYSEDTDHLSITNTHIPATTSITATKVWSDNNNQDGIRPDSVTLTVYADGISTGKTVTVTGTGNTWTATVSGLTKYVNENGTTREIVYTLEEENANIPAGYTPSPNGTTVTNTHIPEVIDVPFTKSWVDNDDQDGIRPDSITVNLLADGVKVDSKTVTASDNWVGSFEDVPKYAGGKEIVYTITEDAVEGYTSTINGSIIINTHTPAAADLTVNKVWQDFNNNDGNRPYGIVIALFENGQDTGKYVTLTTANGWTASWTGMPLYKNGQRISYTTVEIGYYATEADYTSGNMIRGVADRYTVTHDKYDYVNHISTVTNTYSPELTTLNVQKTWNDNNNQDGLQPESITFYLWMTTDASKINTIPSEANGWTKVLDDNSDQMTTTFTRNADGTWTDVDFTGLPKYQNQKQIYYAVTEAPVDGYTTTYSLNALTGVVTVTNSHEVEKTSVTVTKTWDDNDNQDGIRPASVTVHLFGRSKVTALDSITLNESNGWTYTWEDLDKKYNGTDIIYTVTEDAVSGYTATIDGHTITNKHIPATTEISFNKVWNDADNQDGIRPTSITVTLYADGVAEKTMTVTASDNWRGTFTSLPVYRDNGVKIEYTVGEATKDVPDGYTSKVDGTTITNTHEVEKTTYTVTKVWNDNDNQDGIRPNSIEVTLYANNVEKDTVSVTPDANGDWSYTWNDLDKYAGGREIRYSVDELDVPDGYTKVVSGSTITNTHTPATTSVTVNKTWDDASNQDGMRPLVITVNLLANGEKVDSAKVYATTDWSYTFNNLPKYKAGSEIVYTVTEDAVAGYETTIDGYNITNKHIPETTSVTVTKVWDDNDNQDGLRLSVTANLYADGDKIDSILLTPELLNSEGNWEWTFSDLPVYKDGKKVTYTVDEETVPEGYTKTVNGYTITNKHTPETVDIPVSKVWDDNNNQDGIRPDSVTVNLLANEIEIDEITLNTSNGWSHIFEDMPKRENGIDINYTLTEDAVDGYTSSEENGVFTNTHKPEETELTIIKHWDDADNNDEVRPSSITVYLYANYDPYTGAPNSLTLTETNNWTGSFTDLPKYENGEEIRYIVYEEAIGEGYSPSYVRAEDGSSITITNKRDIDTTSITAQKVWKDANNQDGIRPASITLQLYQTVNGTKTAVEEPVTVDASTTWTKQWSGLPVKEDGEIITYSVEEVVPQGYEVEYTTDNFGRLVVTNTHVPATVDVSVNKQWDDNNDQDGKRPDSITVTLYADNVASTTATIAPDANGDWNYTFEDLPQYAHGQEITYTVKEAAIEGYTSNTTGDAAEGYTITNTHEPEKTEVSFNKIWDDADNQDGIRPETIIVTLYADGNAQKALGVTATENWSGTFTDLPVYNNGQKITYTVGESEDDVPAGYTFSVNGTTITNTHIPETTSVTATKVWNDEDNQDGKRPTSIILHLLANGEHTGKHATVTADANGDWSYTWTGLDKYAAGQEINYQVMEQNIGNGYSSSIDTEADGTFTITNTRDPEKTSVNVWKRWNDANDQDGIRPASITVNLYGVDKTIPTATATLTKDNNWQYSFTDLDKYANGKEIDYTINEIAIADYTTEITGDTTNGYTITNTHEVDLTDVTVTKLWEDEDNQDGYRPDEITLSLYGRDKVNALETVTIQPDADGNWSYTWKDLPKNYNGKEIIYTVTETPVVGYTASYEETANTTVITNTHEVEKTEISFSKVWDDAMNQDGKRPTSITVNLLANGTQVATKTVTAADGWSYTFDDLDVYKDGEKIVYTITEEAVEGYTTSIDNDTYTITNTHTPETRDLNVEKVWDDFMNNDGKRPYAVIITLLDNGVPAENVAAHNNANENPLILTAEDGWKGSWEDMPNYRGGQHISYTIVESGVYMTEADMTNNTITDVVKTGYSVTHDYNTDDEGYDPATMEPKATVINKYTPETTGLNVQKIWDDDSNREGVRPDEITVTLYRKIGANWEIMKDSNNQPITAVLSPANEWDADFTGLPAYRNGEKIIYNVVESPVAGYSEPKYDLDTSTNVVTITNTRTVNQNVSVTVTKDWQDNDNQDGIRPDEITVRLYANGIATSETRVLNEANKWTAKWEGLYDYYKGKQITYTVVEETVPEGYKATVTSSREGDKISTVITNTHEPEKISIPVSKTWDDNGNQDGIRPSFLTVTLWANGEKTSKILTLNAAGNWQNTFEGLDKYADGEEISYTVKEAAITGYNVDENGTAQILTIPVVDGKISITNTHEIEKTTLTAIKVWDDKDDQDGKRPESITVHLLANGVHLGESYKRVLTAENNWTYTWENLDKYAAGQLIRYTVYEEPVTFQSTQADGNTAAQAVDGYTASYVRDSETQITITNTYIPEITVITAMKIWDDANDRDGIRPDEITVKLLAGGKDTGKTLTLNDENGWVASWTDLPKYENHGTEIVYTVEEADELAGYTCSIEREESHTPGLFILTNTHAPETTNVLVTKTWVDENNNDGKRPEGIIVQLYANGSAVEGGRVILNDSNAWRYTFQSTDSMPLYVYEQGKLISYYVMEVGHVVNGVEKDGMPEGYEGNTAIGANSYTIDITNTRASEKLSLTVNKQWNDGNDNDRIRPNAVKVTLVKNGTDVETVTLNKDSKWTYTWNDLYKYAGGVEVKYTVRETPVGSYTAGYSYTTSADGKTITATVTNTYSPAGKWFAIEKIWKDNHNAEGLRPASVTVQVYKNGEAYGDKIVLSAANNWKSPMYLPIYDNGVAIKWTIKELSIPRYYTVSYDQYTLTVTNTIQSKEVPKTGDYNNLGMWFGLLGICGAGAAGILFYDKKKKHSK